jgi:hypothetical protein
MMGTGEASGEDRAIQASEKAIANPLLDEISLKGARGVLINITGGTDMTLFELDEAANRIRDEVDPDANIIVGSTLDPSLEGALRVSVVATGIDAINQNLLNDTENLQYEKRAGSVENGAVDELELSTNQTYNLHLDTKEKKAPQISEKFEPREEIKTGEGLLESDFTGLAFNQSNGVKDIQPISSNQLARERLIAAVQKQPNPEHFTRPEPRSNSNVSSQKSSGGAFNNLLQRLTGTNKDKMDFVKKTFWD